jgi:GNAT superfamily N-acetyltransferase
MADILIRLADKADLPDILEMSKGIYGNNDYFPGEFLNYLNDPNRRILIADKDGKAVGLQVVHIIDEGKTAITQALRVDIKYRRQGIGKRLIEECRNYVKENFPQVKFERYSVNSQSVERLGIQKKSDDILFHTAVFLACVVNGNSTELNSRFASHQSADLKYLDKTEFENVLSRRNFGHILFNDKYIVHWQPFNALVSNVQNGLFKDGDSVFASFSGESVESLSHTRWCAIEKCPQLFTVFYTLDKELLKAHILKQLEKAILQHPNETFIFVPLIDTSLIDCASQLLLNDLLLETIKDDFGTLEYYYLYFFEKSLV